MAAFTSKATGDWDAALQTTWNEVGTPTSADTVEIQAGDTVTLTQNEACLDFTLTDGAIVGTGFELTASGNVLYTAGTVTDLSLTMDGTGKTLGWNSGGSGNRITELIVTGTIISSANIWLKKISGTGTLEADDLMVFIGMPDEWWQLTTQKTGTGAVQVRTGGNLSGTLNTSGELSFLSNANGAMAVGEVICGALSIIATDAGATYTVTQSGDVTAAALILGFSASSGSGILNLAAGSTNTIGSIAAGNAANTANAIDFSTSDTTITTGDVLLDYIEATIGGGTITCTGGDDVIVGTNAGGLTLEGNSEITAGTLSVRAGGTLDLAGFDLALTGDYDQFDGTVVGDAASEFTVDGDVLYTTGTIGDLNLTMDGTGKTIAWATDSQFISSLTISGTIATGNTTYCNRLSGAGIFTLSHWVVFGIATVAGWWDFSGTLISGGGGSAFLIKDVDEDSGSVPISSSGIPWQFRSSTVDRALTVDVDCEMASLWVYGLGNGNEYAISTTGNLTIGGAVTLGDTAATTGHGVLNLGTGSHTIASIADGNAANVGNALDFGSSSITLSGILDGDNITCTNTAGVVVGGTITNVDLTGETPLLHIVPAVPGVDNVNVTEINGIYGDPNVYVYANI